MFFYLQFTINIFQIYFLISVNEVIFTMIHTFFVKHKSQFTLDARFFCAVPYRCFRGIVGAPNIWRLVNRVPTYTKNCVDSEIHVLIFADFNAEIGNGKVGIVNGDRIISRNGFILRNVAKMQHLQLINYLTCFVGKWTSVNTCNNNEKSTIDYGLCNSKLA